MKRFVFKNAKDMREGDSFYVQRADGTRFEGAIDSVCGGQAEGSAVIIEKKRMRS